MQRRESKGNKSQFPYHSIQVEIQIRKNTKIQKKLNTKLTCGEEEMKRVEVDDPITVPVPLNLVCATDA